MDEQTLRLLHGYRRSTLPLRNTPNRKRLNCTASFAQKRELLEKYLLEKKLKKLEQLEQPLDQRQNGPLASILPDDGYRTTDIRASSELTRFHYQSPQTSRKGQRGHIAELAIVGLFSNERENPELINELH
eukprot:Ihof_evm10s164 gene=Ihof_evmTU10s164